MKAIPTPDYLKPEAAEGRRVAWRGSGKESNPYKKGSVSSRLWLLGWSIGEYEDPDGGREFPSEYSGI